MSLIKYNNRIVSPGIFNLLNDIFSDEFTNNNMPQRRDFVPPINVKENEKSFQLEMAVPGFDKKDINVEIEEEMLIVSSEIKTESKEENDTYSRREFTHNSFKRTFNIPEGADGSKIEAKHENGVLLITIPKKEVKASLKKMIKVA